MGSAEYYDNFIAYQAKSGINDRIYGLFRRVCSSGISTRSTILEIGCGIGSLTWLLSKKVRIGRIEAIDISPRSIGFAGQRIRKPNVFFTASDVMFFQPSLTSFSRILLFDVLEHLPPDVLGRLFQKITSWMDNDSVLLINIPNPGAILFDRRFEPDGLQEIDNPVYLNALATLAEEASLEITRFETHSVWVKNDYQFVSIKKKQAFVKDELRLHRNLLQKVVLRFRRIYRRAFLGYP